MIIKLSHIIEDDESVKAIIVKNVPKPRRKSKNKTGKKKKNKKVLTEEFVVENGKPWTSKK